MGDLALFRNVFHSELKRGDLIGRVIERYAQADRWRYLHDVSDLY